MERRGERRVEMAVLMTSTRLLQFFCGNAKGEFLPIQLSYAFPPDWNVTHSPLPHPGYKHVDKIILSYIDLVIPESFQQNMVLWIWAHQVKIDAQKTLILMIVKTMTMKLHSSQMLPFLAFLHLLPALVIVDNFKGKTTTQINNFLEENNILICVEISRLLLWTWNDERFSFLTTSLTTWTSFYQLKLSRKTTFHHNILICWLPPNATDRLLPMGIFVNKPAKMYLKKEFEDWYSEMVMQQLGGKDIDDLEITEIQPIYLECQSWKKFQQSGWLEW